MESRIRSLRTLRDMVGTSRSPRERKSLALFLTSSCLCLYRPCTSFDLHQQPHSPITQIPLRTRIPLTSKSPHHTLPIPSPHSLLLPLVQVQPKSHDILLTISTSSWRFIWSVSINCRSSVVLYYYPCLLSGCAFAVDTYQCCFGDPLMSFFFYVGDTDQRLGGRGRIF